MKKGKILIVLIAIIIILIAGLSYYFRIPESEDKTIKPNAKIDIQKGVSDSMIINQGELIFFSGMNSTDKDGKINEYYWDFDDGNSSDSVNPVHKYDAPGEYTVTLTVVDNDGNTNITTVEITVINELPVAIANIQNHPAPGTGTIPIFYSIQFNSTESYDNDGKIIAWHWDFGDGNSSSEQNPIHRYDSVDNYIITLTAADDDGDFATDTLQLEIILHTYKVEWTLEQSEQVIEPNGYTLEGESTEIKEPVEQEYLAKMEIILNWTDWQPVLKDNESEGLDLFELNTITPENTSEILNSTSGLILIEVDYIGPLTFKEYQAETANEAISLAITEAGFTEGGIGEWTFNISAIECKGGNWNNENFDLDIGNFWDLKIICYYYTFQITDVTYGSE